MLSPPLSATFSSLTLALSTVSSVTFVLSVVGLRLLLALDEVDVARRVPREQQRDTGLPELASRAYRLRHQLATPSHHEEAGDQHERRPGHVLLLRCGRGTAPGSRAPSARIEMRSASSASQATVFRKKSWLPWKPSSALLAKSASPTATTRPSGAFGSSSRAREGGGRRRAGRRRRGRRRGGRPLSRSRPRRARPAPCGPCPRRTAIEPLSVRSLSAQDCAEVLTRSWALTPSTLPLPASTLRAPCEERSAAGSPW